jgi:hypothetical protein
LRFTRRFYFYAQHNFCLYFDETKCIEERFDAMITTVEGVYKQGKIELLEMPMGMQEGRVLVTFLAPTTNATPRRRMVYGQFAGGRMSTENNFRIAEWRGETEAPDGN